MRRAIAKSCNTYFYAMGHRVGYDRIAEMAQRLGLGQKFDLPVVSQSLRHRARQRVEGAEYKDNPRVVERPDWTASDTLNASIGQGFLILNPLQLAVMAARIASGRNVQPSLIGVHKQPAPLLGLPPEHLDAVRGGMWEVVNGDGTAGREPPAGSRHRNVRQDRHRAGPQDRRQPARPVAATGNIATTACSSSSRPTTTRAMPARW